MPLPALYAKMKDKEMFAPEEWSKPLSDDSTSFVQVGDDVQVRPGDQVCIRGSTSRPEARSEGIVRAVHSAPDISLVQVVYAGLTKIVDVSNAKGEPQILAVPESGNCQDA